MAESEDDVMKMLMSYYLSADAGAANREKADPNSIDSFAFDEKVFVNDLLSKHPLKDLVSSQQKMMREVKDLDSSMKALVYENYNKFITATDTIKKMKEKVDKMEDQMDRLSKNIEDITSTSDTINSSIGPGREKIEKLSGVTNLLSKRQYLFQLPEHLAKCVSMKAYSRAVKLYTQAKPFLEKYKTLSSFNSINSESEKIIKELKASLRTSLVDPSLDFQDKTDFISFLVDLDEDSESLSSLLVQSKTEAFTLQLTSALSKESLLAYMERLANEQPESSSLESGKATTSASTTSSVENMCQFFHHRSDFFLGEVEEFRSVYSGIFLLEEETPAQQRKLLNNLSIFFSQMLNKFIELINLRLEDLPSKEIIRCLDSIRLSFREKPHGSLDSHLKNFFAIGDRVGILIKSPVLTFMHRVYQQLQSSFTQELNEMDSLLQSDQTSASPSIGKIADNMLTLIITKLIPSFLSQVSDFITLPKGHFLSSYSSDLISGVVENICKLLYSLDIYALNFEQTIREQSAMSRKTFNKEEVWMSTKLLPLSKLCLIIQSIGIAKIDQAIKQSISCPLTADLTFEISSQFEGIRSTLTKTIIQLLSTYIRIQGTFLSNFVMQGKSMPSQTPKKPRQMVSQIIDGFEKMHTQLEETLTRDHEPKLIRQITSGIQLKFNTRVFDHRGNTSTLKLNFTQTILLNVATIVLKSFLEYVRLATFTANGLHQIQIDCFFLENDLLRLIPPGVIDRLTKEVINSAKKRSNEPELLPQSVIRAIYENTKNAALRTTSSPFVHESAGGLTSSRSTPSVSSSSSVSPSSSFPSPLSSSSSPSPLSSSSSSSSLPPSSSSSAR